jgi:glutathione S-transferase
VSESALIAEYLDTTYPDTPKLFPPGTSPLQHAFIDVHGRMLTALWQFAVPQSNTILNPRSEEYFRRTREITFGAKLEDVVPKGKERELQWAKVRAEFARIDAWYQKGKDDGPYLLGDHICFADFVYVAFALWMKKVWGEESAEWKDVKTWNEGRLIALVDALSKYE